MGTAEAATSSSERVTEELHRSTLHAGHRKVTLLVEEYTGPAPSPMLNPTESEATEPEKVVPGQPPLPSVATLCNSAIGAGMLSLPFAFRKSGLLGGVLLTATIGAAEAFTLYVLSKMAERYGAESYPQLVRATLGKKMATFLSLLMVVYMWGACNAYLVIIGDVFSALGATLAGPAHILANRRVIIAAIGLGMQLPLCYIRRLSALSALSSIAVVGFLYTSAVIIFTAYKEMSVRADPWQDVELFRFDVGALFAIPIVVFGFNCHANAVTIFHELTDEPAKQLLPIKSRRKTSKLVNMISVILAAIALIMLGYLSVGMAGYLAYPTTVPSNIINVLPATDPWVQAARAFIGIVVAGHFPLNHHPARSGMLDLAALAGFSEAAREAVVAPLFTFIFVTTSVAVSLFVSDLGDVLHLIGGTAAALLIFFNPGFMLINSAIVKHSTARLASLENAKNESFGNLPDEASVAAAMAHYDARAPLLEAAVAKGIKKTGLVYSPGKSWAAGLALATFAVFIMVTTILTLFVQ